LAWIFGKLNTKLVLAAGTWQARQIAWLT